MSKTHTSININPSSLPIIDKMVNKRGLSGRGELLELYASKDFQKMMLPDDFWERCKRLSQKNHNGNVSKYLTSLVNKDEERG